MTNKISKMYSIFGAKWYDPFKIAWNFIVGRKIEFNLKKFLIENLNEEKDVLELGCGTAMNLEKIYNFDLKFKSYLGLDFTEAMLEIGADKFKGYPNVEFKLKDITKLDDIDKQFDVIICTWVLSHLKYPVEFVNNAQKLLKPGGRLFLVFYTKPEWYIGVWFNPIAEFIFNAKPFNKDIIKDFDNVLKTESSTKNLATYVIIGK